VNSDSAPQRDPLPPGLFDAVITDSLVKRLLALPAAHESATEPIAATEAAELLSTEVARQLSALLDEIAGDGAEKIRRQLELLNSVLVAFRQRESAAVQFFDPIAHPASVLRAVKIRGAESVAPETGLSRPWLFTAAKGTPNLLTELRREATDCDQIDVLVSFITVSGVRKLLDVLKRATERACSRGVVRLRVLTTTYTGATEVAALDMLARLAGAEVRISLDGRRTRLHAKAWIFHRATAFGSAYVGSANFSAAALLGGLEWTVKFTERGQIDLFEKAKAHFETLWNDREFERYDPENLEHRRTLSRALERESGGDLLPTFTFFELEPKPFQAAMLETLAAERAHGRMRNLIVAATGTGKTVVAAFDYRALCRKVASRPRLLFIAHREEILRQSIDTFRAVLRDQSFGDLLVGGREPESFEHLFATVQSVKSRNLIQSQGADYWHMVIIDECHHLAADSFQEFMGAIQPALLLGLTATPERADGAPVLPYFQNRPDGSPAVELRLWHALDLQLLAPFDYFACDDPTDLTSIPWNRSGEGATLDRLVTDNHLRAQLVIDEWTRLAGDPRRNRAIAFCVSVAHAEFMAEAFNSAGINAACITGATNSEVRRHAPGRLSRGELSVVTTCDLYNEGVDIPEVDTLLLLRPTQSPVVFQQQIGRGLRLSHGKTTCLIVDLVGRHSVEFRFDRLFSRLTGLTRRELLDAAENGFGRLPAGCHIQLEKQAREQVLRNLRAATQQNWRRLTAELRTHIAIRGRENIRLGDFLHDQALELEDIYRSQGRNGWTMLRRDAGLIVGAASPDEEYFGRRFGSLLHVDDPDHLEFMQHVAEPATTYGELNVEMRSRLQMLAYQVDGQSEQVGPAEAFLGRLACQPHVRAELGEVAALLSARSDLLAKPIAGLDDTPLRLHAHYGIREILTAVGWLTAERRIPFQAGVLALESLKTELLFVTLDKSDVTHAAIAYHDYAISPEKFHWQSQNSAGPATKAGRRYLEHQQTGWSFQLFVRLKKTDAYCALGLVSLLESHGAKPMSITWQLSVPMPAAMFARFSVLRAV
jgi:superfamily II DNA or RNA helicase